MSGFAHHLHDMIAAWDWQEIGACCLGLDLILFGVLAAYWDEAPAKRLDRDR